MGLLDVIDDFINFFYILQIHPIECNFQNYSVYIHKNLLNLYYYHIHRFFSLFERTHLLRAVKLQFNLMLMCSVHFFCCLVFIKNSLQQRPVVCLLLESFSNEDFNSNQVSDTPVVVN